MSGRGGKGKLVHSITVMGPAPLPPPPPTPSRTFGLWSRAPLFQNTNYYSPVSDSFLRTNTQRGRVFERVLVIH